MGSRRPRPTGSTNDSCPTVTDSLHFGSRDWWPLAKVVSIQISGMARIRAESGAAGERCTPGGHRSPAAPPFRLVSSVPSGRSSEHRRPTGRTGGILLPLRAHSLPAYFARQFRSRSAMVPAEGTMSLASGPGVPGDPDNDVRVAGAPAWREAAGGCSGVDALAVIVTLSSREPVAAAIACSTSRVSATARGRET